MKGKQFTIPHLLGIRQGDPAKSNASNGSPSNETTGYATSVTAQQRESGHSGSTSVVEKQPNVRNNANISNEKQDQALSAFLRHSDYSLAVARLAPQDYHRFHSPVDGVVVSRTDIDGDLYSELCGGLRYANLQL